MAWTRRVLIFQLNPNARGYNLFWLLAQLVNGGHPNARGYNSALTSLCGPVMIRNLIGLFSATMAHAMAICSS